MIGFANQKTNLLKNKHELTKPLEFFQKSTSTLLNRNKYAYFCCIKISNSIKKIP